MLEIVRDQEKKKKKTCVELEETEAIQYDKVRRRIFPIGQQKKYDPTIWL